MIKDVFSNRSKNVSPSLTIALTAKANELKSLGVDVISFGVGEPDFNTPENINNSAKEALDKGFTKYTASAGMPQLRQAICNKFLKDNNLVYTPNQIVVSNGAKQSLFNALQLLVDDGDEVIIPSPYWLSYPELVKLCGGKCVYVDTTSTNFKLTPESLSKAITSKTKVLILNTPNNPTGCIYTLEELTALAKVIVRTNVWVISDEIYEKLVYDGAKHYSIASLNSEIYDQTITINGMSKAYAMTGWRVGYLGAPNEKVAKMLDGMQGHETSCTNSIAQYASITALNCDDAFTQKMAKIFDERRHCIFEELKKIDCFDVVFPLGAFYVFVDVRKVYGKKYKDTVIDSANTLSKIILNEKNVVIIPCEGFGAEGFVRLSYATSIERIIDGVERIRDLINQLN